MNCEWNEPEMARKWLGSLRREATATDLDPNSLAAYLDGTADRELCSLVERTMVSDPAFLDGIIEMRSFLAERPASPARILVVSAWRQRVRHLVAVAAAVASLALGFELGLSSEPSAPGAEKVSLTILLPDTIDLYDEILVVSTGEGREDLW